MRSSLERTDASLTGTIVLWCAWRRQQVQHAVAVQESSHLRGDERGAVVRLEHEGRLVPLEERGQRIHGGAGILGMHRQREELVATGKVADDEEPLEAAIDGRRNI